MVCIDWWGGKGMSLKKAMLKKQRDGNWRVEAFSLLWEESILNEFNEK